MFAQNGVSKKQEADNCGTLPSCPPLAFPYVPVQQPGSTRYAQNDALNNGTLFPALNLPFKAAVTAENVVDSALSELQALEFVVLELGLYLDTHPDDSEAFSLYQTYAAMEKEARKNYVAENGPLFQSETAESASYNWPNGPWPWNQKGGR